LPCDEPPTLIVAAFVRKGVAIRALVDDLATSH
jgi:hypothetical protein